MKKILVVNNDFDTMSLLQTWLEKRSYKVKYTSNGGNVPQLMKDFDPGLVIVDVLQNKVVEQLKNDEETSTVPVILMTGYTTNAKDNDLPVDDIIEKPFDLPLFEKKIEKIFSRKEEHTLLFTHRHR